MELSGALVVAMSGNPSPLKSPMATEPTWLAPVLARGKRLERTVAVALKDAGRAATVRGHYQVQKAILVQITHHHIPRVSTNCIIRRRLK